MVKSCTKVKVSWLRYFSRIIRIVVVKSKQYLKYGLSWMVFKAFPYASSYLEPVGLVAKGDVTVEETGWEFSRKLETLNRFRTFFFSLQFTIKTYFIL